MQIRKANVGDIDLLVTLRIEYLREEKKVQDLCDIEEIKGKTRSYLEKWLPNESCIAFIAEDEGNVFSVAFLSIVERPPRTSDSSYLVGTVYNMFTYPQYRRKGIATKVMRKLLEEAKELGVASVDLLATEDGKTLYDKLGFQVANYTAMRIKI